MAKQSIILFESLALPGIYSPPLAFPIISEIVKGAGYHGSSDAMHTVIYSTTNGWTGQIKIQATLASDPTEKDWFDVKNTTHGSLTTPVPDQATAINFIGNFVWVRAVILGFTTGQINRVLFNHN